MGTKMFRSCEWITKVTNGWRMRCWLIFRPCYRRTSTTGCQPVAAFRASQLCLNSRFQWSTSFVLFRVFRGSSGSPGQKQRSTKHTKQHEPENPSLLVLVPGAFYFSEFHILFSKGIYASMVFDQSFLKFRNLPIAFLKTICLNCVIYG